MFGQIVRGVVSDFRRKQDCSSILSPLFFWAWVIVAWIILSIAAPVAAWRSVVGSMFDV
jgi:hypothetical protein